MHTRLFSTQVWWWIGGLGVVVSLVSLWASAWQGQRMVAPPAATAGEVLAESPEPLMPLPLADVGRALQAAHQNQDDETADLIAYLKADPKP